jgi:hypothetical protein
VRARWLACALFAATAFAADPPNLASFRRAYENPPDDARIMMRWWWFGPSVTKPELEREMRQMKEAGIGGFEVQPVYPLALDDPSKGFHNFAWLSDEFIDALRFTSEKARELGLRMDLTLGSGWPYGGPHIRVTEAAGRLRVDRVNVAAGARSVALPDIGNGEKFIAAFLDGERLNDFDSGRLRLPPGVSGPHTVLFFIASRSGMQVKRPSVGAEGFVLDHYNRAAIERHLKVAGDRLMEAFGSNPPYAVFSDSLEVYNSDWTGDFLEQFQKRRGYDLTPLLPALVSDIGPRTADVRRDWGETLTELAEERYLTPIREWAARHGTRFRSQTYGTPPVVLSSNALVDLPEGEGFRWRQFSSTRWATSASHLYGRPVTSSETWTWLHSPAFRATPLDMKAEADLHFLQGVNQLIGHGWPYSPESAGEPGWRFYAAAVFNAHNPWWIVMPDITRYLQRTSFLLRVGKPVVDVAVYLPTDDAWSGFTPGKTSVNQAMEQMLPANLVPQILDAGYNFDFIDDAAVGNVGIQYPVLVIPPLKRMPGGTATKIYEYQKRGGKVVDLRGRTADGLSAELAKLHPPDLPHDDAAIGFVHRKLDYADVYFVVNTSNHRVHVEARPRAAGNAAWFEGSGDFAPYESRVLLVSKDEAAGVRRAAEEFSINITGEWKVSFPALSYTRTMHEPHSWTDDERTEFYSGQAVYEKTITVPRDGRWALDFGPGTIVDPERRPNGMRALLDPPVREAALVYVNGQLAGSVWKPPFQVDVSKLVHAGENQLRIVVANTAINTMAGHAPPDYKLLNLRFGERFQPQDMNGLKPLPSGILGGIRLSSLPPAF